ncbi:hypothetical protein LV779_08940 [Streptomyces thinghirensis]|nr:hypothetical protein [Streptomyces thinghirensis]
MARFEHTVTLAPVPRRWFESCVTALHDLAEDLGVEGACLRLPDGRLLPGLVLSEGRHLRPGARYRPVNEEDGRPDAGQAVTVLAWDRHRETALEAVTLRRRPGTPGPVDLRTRLVSAARPREVWFSATLRTGGDTGEVPRRHRTTAPRSRRMVAGGGRPRSPPPHRAPERYPSYTHSPAPP